MPLEIRELIIRAQIEPDPAPGHAALEQERANRQWREGIIREVMEQMEEWLARRHER